GLRYYPKLSVAVPFTPATGPRVLCAPDRDPDEVTRALGEAAAMLAERLGASSVHWLFCTPAEAERLAALSGHVHRLTHQFHWVQRGWTTFEEFLGDLTAKRRKEIRRERRQVAALGLEVRVVPGPELAAHEWEALYAFYADTTA